MEVSEILVTHVSSEGSASGNAKACLHSHDGLYEIMVLKKGSVVQVQPSGESVIMNPGDITFAPPSIPHGSYRLESHISEWFLIYFPENIFGGGASSLFQHIQALLGFMDEQAKEDFFLVRGVQNLDIIIELLQSMLEESRHQWSNQQEQLQLLVGQWFHWLLRDRRFSTLDLVQQEVHPHERWVRESLQYIQTQFNRPELGVQEVMGRVPMSRSQFFQVFKEQVGRTFSDYLNEIRLNEASALLRETSLPITEILYRVGYQNPSHFGHRFKKLFGESPRDYRKSNPSSSREKNLQENFLGNYPPGYLPGYSSIG